MSILCSYLVENRQVVNLTTCLSQNRWSFKFEQFKFLLLDWLQLIKYPAQGTLFSQNQRSHWLFEIKVLQSLPRMSTFFYLSSCPVHCNCRYIFLLFVVSGETCKFLDHFIRFGTFLNVTQRINYLSAFMIIKGCLETKLSKIGN